MHPLRSLIAVTTTVVVSVATSVRAQSPEAIREFREQLAEAQKEYSNVECQAKMLVYKSHGQISQIDEQKVLLVGRYRVTEWASLEQPGTKRVSPAPFAIGSNQRYWFNITRKGDGWVLREVGPPFTGYDILQSPFAVLYSRDSYHSLLGRAGTKVVGRSRVEWRGHAHDEWVIDAMVERDAGRAGVLEKVRIGLFVRPDHPVRVYGVRVYDPENPTNWLNEYVLEYSPGDEKWPALRTLEDWVTDKTDWVQDKSAPYKPWRHTRYEIHSWKKLRSSTPGKEFTLSGYGLPEPKKIPEERTNFGGGNINLTPIGTPPVPESGNFWLWIVGGVLLLAVAITFVWWKRRRSRATSEK